MIKLKKAAAHLVLAQACKAFPDASLNENDIFDMIEFPPDAAMGVMNS